MSKKDHPNKQKRPFTKDVFETVLKAATRPIRQEQSDEETEQTSESHRPDNSNGTNKR
jgi:hypothetical protein